MEDSMEVFFRKKLGIKPPYDPVVPLVGIYPEKTKIEKDICTPAFIVAVLPIARIWKQARLSIDEWMDEETVVHIYNGMLLSHKKERIWVSSSEVDEPRVYYTE